MHITRIEDDHIARRDREQIPVAEKITVAFLDESDHVVPVLVGNEWLAETAIRATLANAGEWRDGAKRLVRGRGAVVHFSFRGVRGGLFRTFYESFTNTLAAIGEYFLNEIALPRQGFGSSRITISIA